MTEKEVCIIGLGNMGGRMATHLLTRGFKVYGYDIDNKKLDELQKIGIIKCVPDKVFDTVDTVILSLPTLDSIKATLEKLQKKQGSIVIDMSTVPPQFSMANYEYLRSHHMHYLDAPVIGMPNQVGNWTIPVGGDHEAFENVKPILSALASKLYFVGSSGKGATIKIINNMISLTTWAVISEAIVVAKSVGLDLLQVYEIIRNSGGGAVSPMLERMKRVASNDYENICSVNINIKDLEAAVEMGNALGVPLFVTSSALNLHLLAKEKGLGNLDMDAIPLAFEKFSSERSKVLRTYGE
jgi:3-hydroxyisobutyrate dehydrogenase-like beta-hydroxyacid dehydrogenase